MAKDNFTLEQSATKFLSGLTRQRTKTIGGVSQLTAGNHRPKNPSTMGIRSARRGCLAAGGIGLTKFTRKARGPNPWGLSWWSGEWNVDAKLK